MYLKTGIIDTRPLDQRSHTSFAQMTNNVTTNFNLVTISSENVLKPSLHDKNINNSYSFLIKTNGNNNIIQPTCNNLNSNLGQSQRQTNPPSSNGSNEAQKPSPTSSSSSSSASAASFPASINQQVPTMSSDEAAELYENVKMKSGGSVISFNMSVASGGNNNPNNVSYENINLEYINRLMNEGYSKENVVAALGISRNNFEMACDILHQFVNTHHQTTTATGKVCENNR